MNATEADHSRSTVVFTRADAATNADAIPIPVFVGTLVGVIAFLMLLAVTVVIIIISCVFIKRYNGNKIQGRVEDHGYDYVTETGTGNYRAANPIEMMVNEAYGTSTVEMMVNEAYGTSTQASNQENFTELQGMETQYEEIR